MVPGVFIETEFLSRRQASLVAMNTLGDVLDLATQARMRGRSAARVENDVVLALVHRLALALEQVPVSRLALVGVNLNKAGGVE